MSVETHHVPEYAAQAFETATAEAVRTWARILKGVYSIRIQANDNNPTIRIHGVPASLFPSRQYQAICYYSYHEVPRFRSGRQSTILVSLQERSDAEATCISPAEVFHNVMHELGHSFGLGECADHESLMSGGVWWNRCPVIVANPEAHAIVRWQIGAMSALIKARSRKPPGNGDTQRILERIGEMTRWNSTSESRSIPVGLIMWSPERTPDSVRHLWYGSDLVAAGCPNAAVAELDAAVELLPDCPEPLLRRGTAKVMAGGFAAGVTDLWRAMQLDPHWDGPSAPRTQAAWLCRYWGNIPRSYWEQIRFSSCGAWLSARRSLSRSRKGCDARSV